MKKIVINEIEYSLIEDLKDAFSKEEVEAKMTDYFNDYDYVIGDWAYGKLRLKGFCKKENEKCNELNDYSKKADYIKNNCAYGCKYFVLEKITK